MFLEILSEDGILHLKRIDLTISLADALSRGNCRIFEEDGDYIIKLPEWSFFDFLNHCPFSFENIEINIITKLGIQRWDFEYENLTFKFLFKYFECPVLAFKVENDTLKVIISEIRGSVPLGKDIYSEILEFYETFGFPYF